MKPEEKDRVMRRFKTRDFDVLVSTTVIEVGIDVPNATVIAIEHAERFGLAQLHQLRGRVGRGEAPGHCVLVVPDWTGEEAYQRLTTLERSTDGFYIAEADLALRGPGDFLGTRQAGLPPFRVASLVRDSALLRAARSSAVSRSRFATRKSGSPACRVPRKSPGPRSARSASAMWKPSVDCSRVRRRW